jgi:N-acetylmuramoyl-L-alanine amidase
MLRLGTAARTPEPPAADRQKPLVVVIDPGHGGSARGACNPRFRICEKTLAMDLAWRTRAVLETLPGVKVVLTRHRDVHRSLYARTRIAETSGGHLFLSLHANASPRKNQHGFEVFVYPPLTPHKRLSLGPTPVSEGNRWEVSTILSDLHQQALRRCSVTLAEFTLIHLASRMPARLNRGLKQQHLGVLSGLKIPGILVEVGFLDHPIEGRRLLTSRNHQRIAQALRDAVLTWMKGVGRTGCSPDALRSESRGIRQFLAPGDTRNPSIGKWKPKRWKPRHLPNTVPWLKGRRRKHGLLVWST